MEHLGWYDNSKEIIILQITFCTYAPSTKTTDIHLAQNFVHGHLFKDSLSGEVHKKFSIPFNALHCFHDTFHSAVGRHKGYQKKNVTPYIHVVAIKY